MISSLVPLGGPSTDAPGSGFEELPPGLCSLRLAEQAHQTGFGARLAGALSRHAWADPALCALASFHRPASLLAPGRDVGEGAGEAADAAGAALLLAALRTAVATRCRCIDRPGGGASSSGGGGGGGEGPRPAPVLVLFSGGVDSTLLAALAHEALPPGVPIDLASVCFEGAGQSPDRLAALDALAELQGFAPGREWRLILVRPLTPCCAVVCLHEAGSDCGCGCGCGDSCSGDQAV